MSATLGQKCEAQRCHRFWTGPGTSRHDRPCLSMTAMESVSGRRKGRRLVNGRRLSPNRMRWRLSFKVGRRQHVHDACRVERQTDPFAVFSTRSLAIGLCIGGARRLSSSRAHWLVRAAATRASISGPRGGWQIRADRDHGPPIRRKKGGTTRTVVLASSELCLGSGILISRWWIGYRGAS